jgi:hypothetical protein
MEISDYRRLTGNDFCKHPIVKTYNALIANKISILPLGTWQKDENVIILIRYVLEVKLCLTKEEVPKITRTDIKENKLLVLLTDLNQFES